MTEKTVQELLARDVDGQVDNARRAEWASGAVATFGYLTGQSDPAYLTDPEGITEICGDLIANIFHLAATVGVAPEQLIEQAVGHFEEEVAEETSGS